ncbi:MAG: hypothetical protein ACPG0L_04845 [Bacteroidia bacterium]
MTEINNQQVRICANKFCEARFIGGRSDKKYCSAKCRSADYQYRYQDTIKAERKLTRGNRNNERILNDLYGRLPRCQDYKGYVEVTNTILIAAGYDKYYTGQSGLSEFDGKKVQSYFFHRLILLAHPHKVNTHLIYKKDEV